MSPDVTDLIVKMLEAQGEKMEKLENKVDELIALKNKLIAAGVVLSSIFAFIFDWVKDFFSKS